LLALLKESGTLSVSAAVEVLDANRHPLKNKFRERVSQGYAELKGEGHITAR